MSYDINFNYEGNTEFNKRVKRMVNRNNTDSAGAISAINDSFLHDTRFYFALTGVFPCVLEIERIDLEKAIQAFRSKFANVIEKEWFKRAMNHSKNKIQAVETFFLLKGDVLVSFNDHDTCRVQTPLSENEFFDEIAELLKTCRIREKREPHTINLITRGFDGLDTTPLQVTKTKLNIETHYNDDLPPVHQIIVNRLSKKDDKGIILLHGLPGTGKTTYLRHLTGIIKKKIMFIPPHLAVELTDPNFINLLIENKNSILIIEDAENIISSRKQTGSSVVSTLLNISDGLLADCLNIQIICTFNTSLANVDEALLRKGRLIAKYEFGKLHKSKSQSLLLKLGVKQDITTDLTLAEIYNFTEFDFSPKAPAIGFKKTD